MTATRTENLLRATRRLIVMTAICLGAIIALFGVTLVYGQRFMVSWVCFGCGILGGFVSIQQRMRKFSSEELALLSDSWFQILLVPIYGGVFALVLYIGFLSQIVTGALFPAFSIAPFSKQPTSEELQAFLSKTYPASGIDLAKLLFWSFVAGFSERLLPQIIGKLQPSSGE